MNKLTVSFMLAFFFFSIFSGIMEGGGGLASATLTSGVTATDTTLAVRSTGGFLKSDIITIGDEDIFYQLTTDTQFLGCARGFNGTEAKPHSARSQVYTPEANVINVALGFNITSTGTEVGFVQTTIMLKNFFFIAVPRLTTWDFNYLKTGAMQYLRYFLYCVSVGFILSIAMMVVSALGGLLQGRWT